MKLLILLLALCAFAQADCDFEGLQTCLTEWSEDLLGGVTGFFDSETGWCNILRDLFNCAYDNCDDLVEQDAFQQAVSLTDQANCGIWNLQFDSSLNFCGIFGDPHVVSITKDGYTAKDCDFLADSGETVFADGDNTITVVADSNVNWVDQNLTATRSVSIANSRSGNTYTFSVAPDASSISPFDEVTENDLTVGSNSFRDAVKNTFVRVSAFSNQADNQAWINVYIRSAASTQTGVCAGDTCVYSGAAAKRNLLTRKNAARSETCDLLSGDVKDFCESDVANAGEDWAKGALDAQNDISLYSRESGNLASITGASFMLVAIILSMVL